MRRKDQDTLKKIIVTVDVEDWLQSTWDHSSDITQRSVDNTLRLLDLLARQDTKATMFVLGKFAKRFPKIVRRLADEGHEVASHGYSHIEIFKQTRREFREDISHSKALLEDLISQPILGYRAPDFSIVPSTLWALDVITQIGYQYDSSIFPIKHKRYGIPWWPFYPTRVILRDKKAIIELPIASVGLLGRQLPVGGGGYHRLLPYPLIKLAVSRVLNNDCPFVFYCHPYEIDHKEFRSVPVQIPITTQLHQGLGRKGFENKLTKLLHGFDGITVTQAISNHNWPDYQIRCEEYSTYD